MNRFLTLIFFAVAVSVSGQAPDFIPSDGLLGLWPLNGSAGDLTGNYVNSSVVGGDFTDDRLGNANSALMLNGTDEYVVIDGPIEVEDFTIALWFLAEQEQYTVQTEVYPLVYVGMDSGISPDCNGFGTALTSTEIVALFGCVSAPFGSSTPTPAVYGSWIHLALSFSSLEGTVTYFVNGEQFGTRELNNTFLPPSPNIFFGAVDFTSYSKFHGALDEIGLWNRALSNEEVQQLFLSSPTIQGCIIPEACNYNPAASFDDGSCIHPPDIDLGDDIETCEDSVMLDAGPGFNSYLWSTGDTTQTLSVLESGEISVQGTQDIQFSLDFTGEEQNITISEIPEYEAESHTVSVWCKPAGFSNYDLVSKDDEANNRQWLLQITNQGRFQGHVWTGDDDLTEIQSPTVMESGQWYYLTQTWDGELFKTYINGNLEGVKVTQGPLQTGDHPITIGGDDLAPNFWTNGLLDDVEIWDIALNEEAIQSFMMCGPEGDEDGLVGLWRFNEGEGSSVYDMSIHGNHGDVNGIQWSNDIPETICTGQCSSSATIAVNILGQGCTAPEACNYNPTASCDDGSCIYPPVIDLGDDIETCEESVVLDAGPGFDSYLWSTGETTQQINAVDDGEYSVSASINPAINEFALDFDGSTGSAQPEGPISFGMESFTVSIDCKLRAFEGNDSTNDSYIVGHPLTGGTNDHGFKIQTISESINNGGFTAHINDEGTTHYHVISYSNELDANVVTDRWYDLTIVVDRDNALFSFYVDGQLVGNEIIHDDFGDLDHPDGISLGIQSIHGSHLLNGFLDNLHIWDIPLSAERVAALQFAPPSVGETGLLGYWDFDEGQGSVANDLTGQSPSVILHDVLWTGDAPNVFSGPGCQSEDSCLVSFLLQGCTDPDACNFDLEAICDDGNCATCEALQGACGPGTIWDSETSQCVIEEPCGWNPDSDDDSLVGVSDLLMFLSVFGSEWPVFNCGDPVLYQGYGYETVQIGEQCWFAENLRSTSYTTGDEITSNLSQNDWTGTIDGASCVYGEGESPCENFSPSIEGCNPEESLEFYGRLYNWFAVTDERGLCPTGWHIPNDNQWQVLSAQLGGSVTAGFNMKSTSGWRDGGNGDNSSGFNGYPGGDRYADDGEFYSSGNTGFWWSSTFLNNPQEPGASFYYLEFSNDELKTTGYPPNNGMSVRCIKD